MTSCLRNLSGATLIEVLVTSALLLACLGLVGGLLRSTREIVNFSQQRDIFSENLQALRKIALEVAWARAVEPLPTPQFRLGISRVNPDKPGRISLEKFPQAWEPDQSTWREQRFYWVNGSGLVSYDSSKGVEQLLACQTLGFSAEQTSDPQMLKLSLTCQGARRVLTGSIRVSLRPGVLREPIL